MKELTAAAWLDLAADIEHELGRLAMLADDIGMLQRESSCQPAYQRLFTENLALKLHNFYTGCERIMQIIATELNGSLPSGYDWHKRLLYRLTSPRQGRPTVLSEETARGLEDFLGFRHVVRHLYGFEIDRDRLATLLDKYPAVWQQFKQDITEFLSWIRSLAETLERDVD